ncbi:MAG TPA: glycosyltransferase 87 family protein [Dongiaceae bacterium]
MTTALETSAPDRRDMLVTRIGIGVWLLFNLVILVLVWRNPGVSSVVGNYQYGALGWWAGNDVYGSGIDGFIYLPSFALVYTPFALLGEPWGDILWRIVSVGLLTYAVWRALRLYLPAHYVQAFGPALLLILPAGSAALRNGQASTLLVALMLLAALAIAERRWWVAALLLALAFATKPLAIVMLLLASALYRPLALRLMLCTVIVLLLPLVNSDPLAAWHLYGLGVDKVLASSMPGPRGWSDITGLLGLFGLVLSPLALTILRVASALATLLLGLLARRRQDSAQAALSLFALSTSYLMLMSPRTEENTYIMLAVSMALFAMLLLWPDGPIYRARTFGGWMIVALCIALGAHAYGNWIFRPTKLWLKPLICIVFLATVIQACRGRLFQRSTLSIEPIASSPT